MAQGSATSGQGGAKPWLDTSLPFDQRAALLVKQMSLEEKVSQLDHVADAVQGSACLPTTGGMRVCTG